MEREEALKIIEANCRCSDSKLREACAFFIPELKESEESEDERIKKAIKYGLDYVFTNNTTVYETTKEQCLAWLERQGEKPTWSEEDIRKIKLICTYLDAYKAYQTPVGAEYIDGCISWAKALISRVGCEADCTTTWKPSEGQLECLGYAIDKAEHDFSPLVTNRIYLTLKGLREQLEKLAE